MAGRAAVGGASSSDEPARRESSSIARRLVLALGFLALLYFGFAVAQTILDPKQWDLAVYRHAASLIAAGENPYLGTAALPPRRSGEPSLPFVYPPHFAAALGALAGISSEQPRAHEARRVDAIFLLYLGAKLAAAATLLVLWRRFLASAQPPLRFVAGIDPRDPLVMWASLLFLAVLGFRETLLRDLYSGNVSLFEQVALWAGFLALTRGRWVAFVLWSVTAALAKLTLAVFLPLSLLASQSRSGKGIRLEVGRWWAPCAAVTTLFALLIGGDLATQWSVVDWWHIVGSLDERGRMNPCSLALWRDLAQGVGASPPAAHAAWLLGSLLIGATTVRALLRYRPTLEEGLLLLTTSVVLVLPRFKDYGYVMLIPAAWWVLCGVGWRGRSLLLILLCVHLWDYQPLIAAAVVWLCMLRLLAMPTSSR